MRHLISLSLQDSARSLESIEPKEVEAVVEALVKVFRSGGKLIILGNGGSAADAMHLAAELAGRYLFDRPPLPAMALTNLSTITAVGNDYSFQEVFARQVRAYARPGDAVLGISTSGESPNVLEAMAAAREMGALTLSFSGSRGRLRGMADVPLCIPSERTPRIQEGYMAAGHLICGLVESALFGRKAVFIDRDDTISPDCPYCARPEDLVLYPGVPEAIRRLNEAGYLVLMVTNQSGIGRGYFSPETLERIHARMQESIAAGGGRIDAIYHCPHHPDEGCGCRKPEVGMVSQAMCQHNIDLARSWMVGDAEKDMEMGRRCGMRTLRVGSGMSFVDAVGRILGED